MSSAANGQVHRRLEKELDSLRQSPPPGCWAHPKDGNLFEWTGMIQGPESSPYAGGTFKLDIHIPQTYPFHPPTVTFVTKIYHPNIDSDSGSVGLNILHHDWSNVLTVEKILLSLCAFLATPDPDDGIVPEIAHEYETNRLVYEYKAMQWTQQFAKHTQQPIPAPQQQAEIPQE